MKKHALISVALAGVSLIGLGVITFEALALEEGPLDAAQARSGRGLYAANCSACHGPNLQGAGEAPALAGATFISAWGNRPAADLYNQIKASMPYGNGNSL